jgi:ABC-2 type transport system permease protein
MDVLRRPARASEDFAESVALYWRLVGARARSQMQYKVSFGIRMAGNIVATLCDFIVIAVVFGQISSLAGWTLPQVAFLFGLATACFGLAEVFAPGFDQISPQILLGSFDRVLTRPRGAFFQILASELALRKASRVVQGGVIVAIALGSLSINWTVPKVLALALAVPSGMAIFFSIFVLGAASVFWTVQSNEVVNVFTNGGVAMLSYPLEIYQDWLRRFATFIVPLAFVSYYPTLYVLDRPDPLGFPTWFAFLSPVAAAIFAGLASLAWSLAVRHYTSTGS